MCYLQSGSAFLAVTPPASLHLHLWSIELHEFVQTGERDRRNPLYVWKSKTRRERGHPWTSGKGWGFSPTQKEQNEGKCLNDVSRQPKTTSQIPPLSSATWDMILLHDWFFILKSVHIIILKMILHISYLWGSSTLLLLFSFNSNRGVLNFVLAAKPCKECLCSQNIKHFSEKHETLDLIPTN